MEINIGWSSQKMPPKAWAAQERKIYMLNITILDSLFWMFALSTSISRFLRTENNDINYSAFIIL